MRVKAFTCAGTHNPELVGQVSSASQSCRLPHNDSIVIPAAASNGEAHGTSHPRFVCERLLLVATPRQPPKAWPFCVTAGHGSGPSNQSGSRPPPRRECSQVNSCALFYGRGWLATDAKYHRVRAALLAAAADTRYVLHNLVEDSIRGLLLPAAAEGGSGGGGEAGGDGGGGGGESKGGGGVSVVLFASNVFGFVHQVMPSPPLFLSSLLSFCYLSTTHLLSSYIGLLTSPRAITTTSEWPQRPRRAGAASWQPARGCTSCTPSGVRCAAAAPTCTSSHLHRASEARAALQWRHARLARSKPSALLTTAAPWQRWQPAPGT